MKKVEKILALTDLSELSGVGLEYALELARGWGAAVIVYHVANAALPNSRVTRPTRLRIWCPSTRKLLGSFSVRILPN